MKIVKLDDELYQYIASQTEAIGEESPSDILRRLLNFPQCLNDRSLPEVGETISMFETFEEDQVAPKKSPKGKKGASKMLIHVTQQMENLLNSDAFQQEKKGVNRFLQVLSLLYKENPEGFAAAVEPLQGHTRIYFARDEETLLSYGNHTKPKHIPESPFWVITNTNRQRKMLMIEKTMSEMQLPQTLIEKIRQFF